jgi:hypothetical protein
MRVLWCWRCKAEMPMLEDADFFRLHAMQRDLIMTAQKRSTTDGGTGSVSEVFTPIVDEYERLTGVRVASATVVMHHRLAGFGPPCGTCSKPLRTPIAQFCLECGARRGAR